MSDPFDDPFETDRDELLDADAPGSEYEQGNFDVESPDPSPPSPSVPNVETNYADVDPRFRRRFWALVVALNVGIFAASLGLLLVAFRGRYVVGGQLVLASVVVLGYAARRYRQAKRRLENDGFDLDPNDEDPPNPSREERNR